MNKVARSEEELAVDVGFEVFKARTKSGFTQERLAKRLKTKQSAVSRIENGTSLPSFRFLMRIAKVLKVGLKAPEFKLHN